MKLPTKQALGRIARGLLLSRVNPPVVRTVAAVILLWVGYLTVDDTSFRYVETSISGFSRAKAAP